MGCNDTTAMASSGMLCTNSGDFLEQDETARAAAKIRTMDNLFMGNQLGLNIANKDTTYMKPEVHLILILVLIYKRKKNAPDCAGHLLCMV